MDNINVSGFGWVRGKSHSGCTPPIMNVPIASGYAPAVDPGTANYAVGGLYPGDPISRLSTGYGQLCPGVEDAAATGVVSGIMASVAESGYWNGTEMTFGTFLPSGITYGSNESRRTYIKVIPVDGQLFEIAIVNDGVASKADLLALLNENADHNLTLFATGAAGPKALPKLDFVATPTTTAQWRVVDFSENVELRDYSGLYPKCIVEANEALGPRYDDDGV